MAPETPASAPDAPAAAGALKFPCPQCGADVLWHPGAKRMRCGYCGFERDAIEEGEETVRVLERSLEEGLKNPEKVGWGMERKAVRCTKCGAVETLGPGVAATRCAFCGTPAVVEAPPDAELVRPQGVLPFRVSRHDALGRFRAWLGKLWFRPSDLGKRAEIENIQGVYVPFWTFDAQTVSDWTAESGTRRGTGKNARIEWRRVSGTLEHFFDDLPVAASRGVDGDLLRKLEPFPTAELAAYDPDYLSGFLAEEYGVGLAEAYRRAHARMTETLEAACRAEVPGDHCRNLEVRTRYSGLAYKSGLVPIWIAAYEYGGKSFAYYVNGATGKATGVAPWSWVKIVLAVLAVAVVLLLLKSC